MCSVPKVGLFGCAAGHGAVAGVHVRVVVDLEGCWGESGCYLKYEVS